MDGEIISKCELKQITEIHTIFKDGTEIFEYLRRDIACRRWAAYKHDNRVKYSCIKNCILNRECDVCLKDGKITRMYEYSDNSGSENDNQN